MSKQKAIFYRCNKCNDYIFNNTNGKLKFCSCGSLGIDGNFSITRIIGRQHAEVAYDIKNLCCYRIKQISTGLYFASRGNFSKVGRIYSRKPSLTWVNNYGECIIETFYLLKPSQLNKIANGRS